MRFRQPDGSRFRAGFSMIEMMVVVAIVAIVAAAGAMEFAKRKPVADLNQAAWEITSELRRARLQAISRNTSCDITIDTGARTCSTWTDTDDDGVVDDGEEFTADLSDIDNLSMWVHPGSTFGFDSRGNLIPALPDFNYQFLQIYMPYGGLKGLFIYPNGQVDLRNQ